MLGRERSLGGPFGPLRGRAMRSEVEAAMSRLGRSDIRADALVSSLSAGDRWSGEEPPLEVLPPHGVQGGAEEGIDIFEYINSLRSKYNILEKIKEKMTRNIKYCH